MTAGDPWSGRHAGELDSIRGWLCRIEDEAGPGFRVERELKPPYGWNLVDASGAIVCSGPLERLERWPVKEEDDDTSHQ
ncbi:hypothetical protein [Nocardia pseudobrasiliensis]|uniref:Uncharacterized protein n=1 Tax=Nocardia pseudobrasiliensis TaxID=45979 RepID=A0A370I7W2_9NOCA|nr:hypothetical protein [Nocardia pseudobrasiliensis]RDI66826.1 hypothetical protein DFR76_104579 [Nocardia pseudobrasiliensis]